MQLLKCDMYGFHTIYKRQFLSSTQQKTAPWQPDAITSPSQGRDMHIKNLHPYSFICCVMLTTSDNDNKSQRSILTCGVCPTLGNPQKWKWFHKTMLPAPDQSQPHPMQPGFNSCDRSKVSAFLSCCIDDVMDTWNYAQILI